MIQHIHVDTDSTAIDLKGIESRSASVAQDGTLNHKFDDEKTYSEAVKLSGYIKYQTCGG